MKKLKILIFALVTAVFSVSFCGCGLFKNFSAYTDYKPETGITADSLMAVRDKIRAFNISIDTQYYTGSGWFSRIAGTGLGSGVVFEEDDDYYYALTNNHVITNVVEGKTYNVKYTVTDIMGTEYANAQVVGYDNDDNDLAVIKFTKKLNAGYTLSKADYTARKDTNVAKNEFVFAVGNPSGVNNIVTYGEIIGWSRIGNVSYNVIHHNALINPGNSGGALCDIDGNLLGLNTWGSEDADDNNYSISLKEINEFIDAFHASRNNAAA